MHLQHVTAPVTRQLADPAAETQTNSVYQYLTTLACFSGVVSKCCCCSSGPTAWQAAHLSVNRLAQPAHWNYEDSILAFVTADLLQREKLTTAARRLSRPDTIEACGSLRLQEVAPPSTCDSSVTKCVGSGRTMKAGASEATCVGNGTAKPLCFSDGGAQRFGSRMTLRTL